MNQQQSAFIMQGMIEFIRTQGRERVNQINQQSAVPPYVLEGDGWRARSERWWNAACFVRYQSPTIAARANATCGLHPGARARPFG